MQPRYQVEKLEDIVEELFPNPKLNLGLFTHNLKELSPPQIIQLIDFFAEPALRQHFNFNSAGAFRDALNARGITIYKRNVERLSRLSMLNLERLVLAANDSKHLAQALNVTVAVIVDVMQLLKSSWPEFRCRVLINSGKFDAILRAAVIRATNMTNAVEIVASQIGVGSRGLFGFLATYPVWHSLIQGRNFDEKTSDHGYLNAIAPTIEFSVPETEPVIAEPLVTDLDKDFPLFDGALFQFDPPAVDMPFGPNPSHEALLNALAEHVGKSRAEVDMDLGKSKSKDSFLRAYYAITSEPKVRKLFDSFNVDYVELRSKLEYQTIKKLIIKNGSYVSGSYIMAKNKTQFSLGLGFESQTLSDYLLRTQHTTILKIILDALPVACLLAVFKKESTKKRTNIDRLARSFGSEVKFFTEYLQQQFGFSMDNLLRMMEKISNENFTAICGAFPGLIGDMADAEKVELRNMLTTLAVPSVQDASIFAVGKRPAAAESGLKKRQRKGSKGS